MSIFNDTVLYRLSRIRQNKTDAMHKNVIIYKTYIRRLKNSNILEVDLIMFHQGWSGFGQWNAKIEKTKKTEIEKIIHEIANNRFSLHYSKKTENIIGWGNLFLSLQLQWANRFMFGVSVRNFNQKNTKLFDFGYGNPLVSNDVCFVATNDWGTHSGPEPGHTKISGQHGPITFSRPQSL